MSRGLEEQKEWFRQLTREGTPGRGNSRDALVSDMTPGEPEARVAGKE